jgi:hypothetical protein
MRTYGWDIHKLYPDGRTDSRWDHGGNITAADITAACEMVCTYAQVKAARRPPLPGARAQAVRLHGR